MLEDMQRASMWRRISALLCDIIILSIIVVGIAFLLSAVLNYDEHSDELERYYSLYEERYGVNFDIGNYGQTPYTSEEQALLDSFKEQYDSGSYDIRKFDVKERGDYTALSSEDRVRYDLQYSVACEALGDDKEANFTLNLVVNLTLIITTMSLLIGYIITEFVMPLVFGHGRSIGKKIFGIAVMRGDSVKVNNMMLFARSIIGKFTIETMIPAYLVIMLFFNVIGSVGIIVLALLLLFEIILMCVTKNRLCIHDALAGTVCVDAVSQRIFDTEEELIEYKKKIHAEIAAKSEY